MKVRIALIVMLAFALGQVLGADAPKTDFTSSSAKDAKSQFTSKLTQAEREFQAKISASRKEYLAALEKAKSEATRRSDLDEAIRIRDEIAEQKKDEEAAVALAHMPSSSGRELLGARVAGTTWAFPASGIKMTMNANGSVSRSDNIAGRWAPFDEKSFLLLNSNNIIDRFVVEEKMTQVKLFTFQQIDTKEGIRADSALHR